MKKNAIRSTYQCTMNLLTPIHVGIGDKYVKYFDFIYDNTTSKILVFNRHQLLQQVSKTGKEAVNSFTSAIENKSLEHWIKEKHFGIDLKKNNIHFFSWNKSPTDIPIQLRNATGEALVPGSSLKGSLRTAILTRLFYNDRQSNLSTVNSNLKELSPQANLKFADKDICSSLLGPNARENLLRSLTVSDFPFEKNNIKLQEVIVARLIKEGKLEKKFNFLLEKITENSTAHGQISFDLFLSEHGEKRLNFNTTLSLHWLIEAVKMKTERTIETELAYLKETEGKYVVDLTKFYIELKNQLQELKKNEMIIQIAWGSGWNGMTGQLLSQEQLTLSIRKKLQLAPNYTNFPFPKSRRFAISNNKAIPTGWIKLSFTDKETIREQKIKQWEKTKQKIKIKINLEKEKEEWNKKEEFEKYLAIVRGDAIARSQVPKKEGLRDIWPKLVTLEPANRQKLAKAFYQKWKKNPHQWRKKICSTSQWEKVKIVIDILDIDHPDIKTIPPADREMVAKIDNFNHWGEFKNSNIEITSLSIFSANLLMKKFISWGCGKNRAKKEKLKALKTLKQFIKTLDK